MTTINQGKADLTKTAVVKYEKGEETWKKTYILCVLSA